jgi:hypothetical protein
MKLLVFTIALLLCLSADVRGQDLNARVQVIAPKLPTANKQILLALQNDMKDFLNGHKWSADAILPQERIDCNFILNVTAWDGNTNFSGELLVQSTRPVFNSSYSTILLNINDKDFDFIYLQGATIDYTDQVFQSNLASVMAFYAYIIVGFDYDTFSRLGGTDYFASAQNVVNNAQNSGYKGWKGIDGYYNRYWLAENMNNKIYQPLRSFMYDYHRNGLDLMADNAGRGLKNLVTFLPELSQIDRQRLGAMFPLVFFTAKNDELVSIFSNADQQSKVQAYNILSQADPANGNKYQQLRRN